MPDFPQPDSVMGWRLGELEKSFKELRGDFKEAVGALGGGLTALQTQLSAYQTAMSDKYLTRREAEELLNEARNMRKAQDDRLQQQRERIDAIADQLSERGWQLAAALALSAFSLIGAGYALIATHLSH